MVSKIDIALQTSQDACIQVECDVGTADSHLACKKETPTVSNSGTGDIPKLTSRSVCVQVGCDVGTADSHLACLEEPPTVSNSGTGDTPLQTIQPSTLFNLNSYFLLLLRLSLLTLCSSKGALSV